MATAWVTDSESGRLPAPEALAVSAPFLAKRGRAEAFWRLLGVSMMCALPAGVMIALPANHFHAETGGLCSEYGVATTGVRRPDLCDLHDAGAYPARQHPPSPALRLL